MDQAPSIPPADLAAAIENLAANHAVRLDGLPANSPIARDVALLKHASIALEGDPRYESILREVGKIYRPSSIHIGTVGAFLFGCLQAYYGDTPRMCSPLCTQSLPPAAGEATCPYNIAIVDDNDVLSLQESASDRAYIFGYSCAEGKIARETAVVLKEKGIAFGQIFCTEGGVHHRAGAMKPIDELISDTRKDPSPSYLFPLGLVFLLCVALFVLVIALPRSARV